jgi:hypothetical protein
MNERIRNQEWIAPQLLYFVVAKVRCIARSDDLLNKGTINGFVKQ